MTYTFKGGIHVPESKNTAGEAIRKMPLPQKVSIPLSQHIGAHCKPTVAIGDTVARGQIIGDVEAGLGCPVHASIPGRVTAMEEKINNFGQKVMHIIIENDSSERVTEDLAPYTGAIEDITPEICSNIVRRAGISGMGGATFPTYAKINSAVGKVDKLIVNCAECEPYITANHRLLIENPTAVIGGMKILLCTFKMRHGDIAVEDNKKDAIHILQGMTEENDLISVRVMKTKYPQGDERQLIYALTGREIPAGKLPADVGCVVFNAETCAAIYNAFTTGMPLIERVVTVDGDCVENPSNVLCPIGTSYSDLIEFCGGTTKEIHRIINGGPMMGAGQWDTEGSVTKGTSAVLVFGDDGDVPDLTGCCIRCGRCVGVCQMHLMPNYLALFSRSGDFDMCEKYNVMSCVECGACSYICPGGVPITQLNRAAKAKVGEAIRRRAKEANK